ncbi:MAG TPA: TetR family transcriptional regulator [Trebonia sp.]|nr:TetR family transcriptional regulator [Trebonia sp.]
MHRGRQAHDRRAHAAVGQRERGRLTERTFYRYFADKREVLFSGQEALLDIMVSAIAQAPPGAPPIDLVAAALNASAVVLQEQGPASARRRQGVIAANPELRERELSKFAQFGLVIAQALADRGVPGAIASLTAETGMAVFRVSWDRWLSGLDVPGEHDDPDEHDGDPGGADLTTVIAGSLAELRAVTAARA